MENGSWPEVGYHVVQELKRLDKRCNDSEKQIRKNDRRITVIETRNGIIGFISGLVAGGLINLIFKKAGM